MDESLEHLEPQSSHKFDAMSSGESSQLQREVMEDAQRQYEREKDNTQRYKTIRMFVILQMTFAIVYLMTVVSPNLLKDPES